MPAARARARQTCWLVVAAWLSACSAYDPKLLQHQDSSLDSALPDGALTDAPDDDAAGDDGALGDASNNGCVPSTMEFCSEICPETCNGLDDDCDAVIDEEDTNPVCTLPSATATCVSGTCLIVECTAGASDCDTLPANGCEARLDSPQHCGFCYAACTFPNAVARCDAGTCTFDECVPGFGNCDGQQGNGCERTVDSLDNCGGCNVTCSAVDNGQPGCIDLMCGVSECDTGFANCNGDPSDGCEVSVDDVANCGRCGTVCSYDHAAPLCAGRSCAPGACLNGFGDCDGDPLNECEVTLATNVNHCGTCGRACDTGGMSGSAYQCVGGECIVTTCPTGTADCDSDPNNGCETSLRTLTDCGSCGTGCAFSGASASCASGTCAFVACQPGFGNCNSTLNDGCETPLDTDVNCGACAAACGVSDSRMCSGGVCSLASCGSGTADCDNDGTTCEQSLTALTHCGACNARCGDTQGRLPNATAACGGGVCAIGNCDATFANCDGSAVNGCETSLRTTSNCGTCGSACSRPNATSSCASGTCTTTACSVGFGDCDGNADNGCETNTNTNQDCGACNTPCSRANAASSCASGTCATLACNSGFGDCDGNANNGCETPLNSLTHCGACNVACSLSNGTESCATGTCALGTCNSGFGNCDFVAANGCETALNTTQNCNGCGALCDYANSTESCATGTCTLTGCSTGFANCDNNESNGCEQSLSTTAHCGACNVGCNRANASATCSTGTCALGTCTTGFGNCDGDAIDGCETTLGTTSNCGACGDPCVLDETCTNFVCQGAFTYTPSNFDPVGIVHTATPTLACGVTTFNSTTLAFTNWCSGQPMPSVTTRTQSGGPDVVVLGFSSLTVSSGATFKLEGNKPVILAVFGNATINGIIDASGSGITPGAGGNWSCGTSAGGTGGGSCGGNGGGGGGGGHATNGAVGGTSGQGGGTAGVARGAATASPLLGGCNGGNGGGCATTTGGGGGGAVQISSAGVLTLGATGQVLGTGGAGLNGGCGCLYSGGGGGGSGGAVLLEGNTVTTVSGASITANGGTGGKGAGAGSGGGNGGVGGTGSTAPAVGSNSGYGSGGGGGAVGRGYIRGVTSCSLAQTSSISLSAGGTCPPTAPGGSTCRLFANAGHNYFFCDETTRHWNDARSQCQRIGFDLVRVNDGSENAFLVSHLAVAQPYALGGSDAVTPDRWVWVIGNAHFWQGVQNGAAQNGLYTNWETGQPNGANPDEDFAYITNGTGGWNDDDSNPNRPFICESL